MAAASPLLRPATARRSSRRVRARSRELSTSQPNIGRYAEKTCIWTHIDDAVQERLWILARYITGLRYARAFSSWLFSIVRRELRRLARTAIGIDPWDDAPVDAFMAGASPRACAWTWPPRSSRCPASTASSS